MGKFKRIAEDDHEETIEQTWELNAVEYFGVTPMWKPIEGGDKININNNSLKQTHE